MTLSLTLLALSLAAGVVAAWEKLCAPEFQKRVLGAAAVIILVGSLVLQGSREVYKNMEVESLDKFLSTQEAAIEEASGAGFLGSRLFVVDDESPSVYEYQYDEALGKAKQMKRYQILSEPTMQSPIPRETIAKVDDLEAAATYGNNVYVVTSHSLDKKGYPKDTRQLILEIDRFVTLPSKPPKEERVLCPGEAVGNDLYGDSMACVRRAATLTAAIQEALKEAGARSTLIDEEEELNFNIEGLAIDDEGVVFIGLRNPLIEVDGQPFAILLQTTVESVFSKSPKVKLIRLRLEDGNHSYGITSLEYDRKEKMLLILGNGPTKKKDPLLPRIWLWHPNSNDSDEPVMADWSLRMPEKFDAKPEALALSEYGGPAFVFIDAPGHGGQRVVPRKELGLPEVADLPGTGKQAEKRP